jgi:hypothetical protein
MRKAILITLAVLGLCVGAASAATTDSGEGSATIGAAGSSATFHGHAGDNTVPSPGFCPPGQVDPTDLTCGHFLVHVTGPGTVTASVTFPSTAELDLAACRPKTVDSNPLDECQGGTEVLLATDEQTEQEDAAGNLKETASFGAGAECTIAAPCTYEILIVPVFVFTCGDGGPVDCPGIDFTGGVGYSSGSAPGGTADMSGKVEGGGRLGTLEHFAIKGYESKPTKAKVRFERKHDCKFRSTKTTVVTVAPSPLGGGTAHIEGQGIVTVGDVKTPVTFTANAADNGKHGAGDTFDLSAPGCSGGGTLTDGDVKVEQKH